MATPERSNFSGNRSLLIALSSLCAEGTPVLVLEMCRLWFELGIRPTVVTLFDKPTDLRAEFQALAVPVQSLHLPNSGARRYLEMAVQFSRLCQELRPDAFLSMPLGWHTYMAIGARSAGVRRIAAHVGNYPPLRRDAAFEKFRFLVQLGRGTTDKLICCSKYVKRGMEEQFGVPDTELEVIYNGCPVHEVARRVEAARARRTKARFRIGMVARLEVHKDQPTLIRAAEILRQKGLDLEVHLVGEGSRRAEYESLIRSLGLAEHVHLLGMRRDVPELLATFDIFVFAAKPDEGLGVALVEAMAAGVPIVATDVGACREVLDDGTLGALVPPQQPESMAAAVQAVIEDPAGAEARAMRARSKALSTFTIDGMARAYARCLHLAA